MSFRRFIREYFSYTQTEKRGIFILLVLVMIVYVWPFFIDKKEKVVNNNMDEQRYLDSLLIALQEETSVKKKELFVFNPNKLSKTRLSDLGFSKFQIEKLIRYRDKGGRFYKKEDLMKVYGIDSADYARVKNYISIPIRKKQKVQRKRVKRKIHLFEFDPNQIDVETWYRLGIDRRIAKRIEKYLQAGAKFSKAEDLYKIYGIDSLHVNQLLPYVRIAKTEVPILLIELNGASPEELQKLPGIGKVLSKRIAAYRNQLGGFYATNQLLEVYGLKKETLQRISKQIKLDSSLARKLNLNRCSEEKMTKHPYLSSYQAQDIVRYRDRNGKFKSIIAFEEKKLLPDSVYQKMKAYLLVD